MVIVTYLFRGSPLSSHRLLFLISRKGSFQRQDNTYLNLWWTICGPLVGMENSSNCKCILYAGSICHAGRSKLLQLSVLPPELCPVPSTSSPCTISHTPLNHAPFHVHTSPYTTSSCRTSPSTMHHFTMQYFTPHMHFFTPEPFMTHPYHTHIYTYHEDPHSPAKETSHPRPP